MLEIQMLKLRSCSNAHCLSGTDFLPVVQSANPSIPVVHISGRLKSGHQNPEATLMLIVSPELIFFLWSIPSTQLIGTTQHLSHP